MSGKVLITIAGVVLLAGCAPTREAAPEAAPPPAPAPQHPTAAAPTTAAAARTPPPRPPARPAVRPSIPPAPAYSDLPRMVRGQVTWIQRGEVLAVNSAAGSDPVPLFRQAIVLANVRATVAGSRAVPRAEFRRGVLHLDFARGNSPQIADAVNRALGVPEVTRVKVTLPR